MKVSAPLLALLALSGCGRWDAQDGWEPVAVRAVARAAAASGTESLLVLDRAGGAGGQELPWGVRQSLTTGGVQLTDRPDPPDSNTRVLVLQSARRDGSDWLMETRLVHADGSQDSTTWRVRCPNDSCEASPTS